MLICVILVLTACSSTVVVKPNQALLTPLEKPELIEGDTVRDLAAKFEKRGEVIDEANKRFEELRK